MGGHLYVPPPDLGVFPHDICTFLTVVCLTAMFSLYWLDGGSPICAPSWPWRLPPCYMHIFNRSLLDSYVLLVVARWGVTYMCPLLTLASSPHAICTFLTVVCLTAMFSLYWLDGGSPICAPSWPWRLPPCYMHIFNSRLFDRHSLLVVTGRGGVCLDGR